MSSVFFVASLVFDRNIFPAVCSVFSPNCCRPADDASFDFLRLVFDVSAKKVSGLVLRDIF